MTVCVLPLSSLTHCQQFLKQQVKGGIHQSDLEVLLLKHGGIAMDGRTLSLL
ncbi:MULTISPECIES: hypothetical protein [unclassified Paenibacillus]|uniref:hypothetical protein n=1 Tax=unclassified Paenibacillus TaxID=185978 RepID=UPI0030FB390D